MAQPPPPWLVDWLREACCHRRGRSLVLASAGTASFAEVSCALAAYLNEFDTDGESQWRAFDNALLSQLASDPICRDLVMAGVEPPASSHPVRPDRERLARRLAHLGGVILEGLEELGLTADLPGSFHICLSTEEPSDCLRFHMWVNPRRFSLRSLVCVLADSFLDWSCHAEPSSRPTSEISSPDRPTRWP
jgi:hypothetical protein